jgi:hypothetical protein
MKPVCVPCERFYRQKKNGFFFQEGMPVGRDRPQPGRAEPDAWKPYKLWVGDLWSCPDCGAEIVVGCAGQPITEHYRHDFAETVKASGGDQLLVKDC